MNKQVILVLSFALLLAACGPQEPINIIDPITQPNVPGAQEDSSSAEWLDEVLFDVRTGEQVRASDFAGEALLVESFAVWCPTCLTQQREVQQLDVAHITINTDPNEDEELVREYIEQHGFSGHYAVASAAYTGLLIDEFGTGIINAPSAPVILVCPDQRAELLPRGVKRAEQLSGFIQDRC